jgi:2-polyprenyl-3-methyl-5-hydroxy-6-metoxy-1,4-benzoquinol methylase
MTVDSGYGWKDARVPGSYDVVANAICERAKTLGARRVLDIGCGNGAIAGLLASHGLDVVGLEQDEKGCAIAAAAWPAARFINVAVETDPAVLREQIGRFDLVISTEVLEHLYAPRELIVLAAELIEPDGHLVVTTPYHGFFKNLAISLFNGWDAHFSSLWEGGHIKFFSFATLTKLLEDGGFRVTKKGGVGRIPYLWMSMIVTAQPGKPAK